MDEIYLKYKQKKFSKCLELIKSLPESDDVVENLVIDNCKLVCESLVRVTENDLEKMWEIQEQHYLLFEKVISIDSITNSIPLQLKLNVAFNFIYWLSFYSDKELDDFDVEECLKMLHRVLLSVLGGSTPSECTSDISEKVIDNIVSLKELIPNRDHKTVLLVLELAVVAILYVIKLKKELIRKCLNIVEKLVKESVNVVKSLESVNEFLEVKQTCLRLCKFGLCGIPTVLPEIDSRVVDCLHLLQSSLLYLSDDFRGSLKSLQRTTGSSDKSLWNYLVILNAYELEDWSLCSAFLNKMSSSVLEINLKARVHVMRGKLHCVERKHKEALLEFEKALKLCPQCPVVYCYVAQVYGKMGILDLMQENFEKLVETFESDEADCDFRVNFDTILLSWIHPIDEITESEAYYALAVSYGLNENFKSASEAFERVLQLWNEYQPKKNKRVIELPNFLTILHEAAVINLMMGNLVRAEQIALDAIDRYTPQESHQKDNPTKSLLCKDVEWLQKVIHQELLETDMEPRELSPEILYSEDLFFTFPQNVIGLLILSEIQRIQEIDDYKSTLSTVFSMFSKYLASASKVERVDEFDKQQVTLVRALAGKTCVRIAAVQMDLLQHSNVEKMLKRALSCNKGDKDALHKYYKLLSTSGRNREALKLWNTFFKEKETINTDSLQSFSLRFLLAEKITKRELEKIQQEVEPSTFKML